MSHLENDRIKENVFEDFDELFNLNRSFRDVVNEACKFTTFGISQGRGPKYADELSECFFDLFDRLWNFDAELLCSDKRSCVEAFILYNNNVGKLLAKED